MLMELIILLVIVGAGLYLLNLAPIDATVKQVIYVIVVVALIIYALKVLMPLTGIG